MKPICLIAALTVSVDAAALEKRNCGLKQVYYRDTFDKANALSGIEPTASAIDGTADGFLFYQAFNYLKPLFSTPVTPTPPSPPNVAGTSVITQQLRGQPEMYPKNASTVSFNLQYLCYLCFTDTGVSTNVPTSCTIQAAGVTTIGPNNTNVQELNYNPGLINNQYACTSFPADRFSQLSAVKFELVQSSEPQTTVVWAIDNVTYIANEKTC